MPGHRNHDETLQNTTEFLIFLGLCLPSSREGLCALVSTLWGLAFIIEIQVVKYTEITDATQFFDISALWSLCLLGALCVLHSLCDHD